MPPAACFCHGGRRLFLPWWPRLGGRCGMHRRRGGVASRPPAHAESGSSGFSMSSVESRGNAPPPMNRRESVRFRRPSLVFCPGGRSGVDRRRGEMATRPPAPPINRKRTLMSPLPFRQPRGKTCYFIDCECCLGEQALYSRGTRIARVCHKPRAGRRRLGCECPVRLAVFARGGAHPGAGDGCF